MKAWSGFTELLIVTVFILCGIPLLLSLVYSLNHSKFNYLDDKTIYSLNMNDNDMFVDPDTGLEYPNAMLPVHTDFGGALAMAVVQDDYCPEEAKSLLYAYSTRDNGIAMDSVLQGADNTALSSPTLTDVDKVHNGYYWHELQIRSGWEGIKRDKYYELRNRVATGKIPKYYVSYDSPLYFVYNYKVDKWILTAQKVNVFK